jgi:hypothetical protein
MIDPTITTALMRHTYASIRSVAMILLDGVRRIIASVGAYGAAGVSWTAS